MKQRITMLYHQLKGRYGYRRITTALKDLGSHHNHKLIAKLMRHLNLHARIRRQKYRATTNNERTQLKLKRLSPVQYRTQSFG